jgi:hypothetical protein
MVLSKSEDVLLSSHQTSFLEGTTDPDATLRPWEDGEHTIYKRSSERTTLVADWFAERLA